MSCRSTPSAGRGPSRARKAAPTTTVGSTNGTSSSDHSTRRPWKSKRANTAATGIATSTVSTVDAAACQSVNQATWR